MQFTAPIAFAVSSNSSKFVSFNNSIFSSMNFLSSSLVLKYSLNGSKPNFSYKCFVPYTLKGKLAAVELCEIHPVKLHILNWPETEIVHMISGHVTVTEYDGTVTRYKAGDIFVLPEGFKGIWSQTENIRKLTVRHPLFWDE